MLDAVTRCPTAGGSSGRAIVARRARGASAVLTDEIFGPVLAVLRGRDFDHALALANDTDVRAHRRAVLALAARTSQRAADELRAGNIYMNRGTTGAVVGASRSAATGCRASGSKAGGPDYLLQFVEPRVVTENTLRRASPLTSDSAVASPAVTDIDVVQAIYAAMGAVTSKRCARSIDAGFVVTQDPALPWGGRFVGHDGLANFALAADRRDRFGGNDRGDVQRRWRRRPVRPHTGRPSARRRGVRHPRGPPLDDPQWQGRRPPTSRSTRPRCSTALAETP